MAIGNLITTTAASISSGGTINGSLTIEGDLTVNGDGTGNYDEIVDGNMRISSTNQLQFGDTGTYIYQSADGVLDLVSDTEIEINATTIDINGAVDASGAVGLASSSGVTTIGSSNGLTVSAAGVLTVNSVTDSTSKTSGSVIIDGGVGIAKSLFVGINADIDGTLEADAITVGGSSLASVIQAQTVDLATSFTVSANNSTDETVYPLFVDGATGTQGAETDTGLTYNPSTGVITSTQFTGNVTGNVTGNASGTAATVTGGTQASITSAANLVTVGTIGTGVWQGTEVGLGYGGTELVGETDGKIVIADGSGAPVHLDVGSSTAITILGTVGTGVWQGTAVASAYLDADTAHLSGSQTFSGAKTFSANIIMADDTSIGISDSDERIEFDASGDISFLGCDVGIGTSSPSSYDSAQDDFVIAGTGNRGMSIISATDGNSTIAFGLSLIHI